MTVKNSTISVEQVKEATIYFVGIDVHKKNWAVTIRALGMELETFLMDPKPKKLAEHMRKKYPRGRYRSTYEAGFCGFWIHSELKALGFESSVAHAADVPTTDKERVNKRDKVDSRKLARHLESEGLNLVYVPDLEHQYLRSLCRLRHRCAQQGTRIKNRISGYLCYYGHEIEEPRWSRAFMRELDVLASGSTPDAVCLRHSLEELTEQRRRLSHITRDLRGFCRQSSKARVLQCICSVPGVGFITAVTLMTEVIDINRFKKLDHLCSLVGLVPSTNSSGENDRTTGLTRRKNKYMKHLIIEAAWVAVRRDPALWDSFQKMTGRMSKSAAIVRTARKLLNRIRSVWRNKTIYVMADLTAN